MKYCLGLSRGWCSMGTIRSLDKEGYRFVIDGGLAGIIFIFTVGLVIDLLGVYWPEFEPLRAPIGTLAVGVMFGMMFCRIAPIWKKEREGQDENIKVD